MSRSIQLMTFLSPKTGAPVWRCYHVPKTVADLESEIDAELNAMTAQYAENRRLPVLTRRVSSVTVNEPENVAKLLRAWIQDEGR